MERLKERRSHKLKPALAAAGFLLLASCGDATLMNREEKTEKDKSSNIEFNKVGEIETDYRQTDIGYYEYVDQKGRTHVCDIATNPRGGTEGVGLSCIVLPAEQQSANS